MLLVFSKNFKKIGRIFVQNPDRDTIKVSNIIPFSPRKANQKNVSVTTPIFVFSLRRRKNLFRYDAANKMFRYAKNLFSVTTPKQVFRYDAETSQDPRSLSKPSCPKLFNEPRGALPRRAFRAKSN